MRHDANHSSGSRLGASRRRREFLHQRLNGGHTCLAADRATTSELLSAVKPPRLLALFAGAMDAHEQTIDPRLGIARVVRDRVLGPEGLPSRRADLMSVSMVVEKLICGALGAPADVQSHLGAPALQVETSSLRHSSMSTRRCDGRCCRPPRWYRGSCFFDFI